MTTSVVPGSRRRRLILIGIVLTVGALILVAGVVIVSRTNTVPAASSQSRSRSAPTSGRTVPGGWDVAAENRLAERPMLVLPLQAAQPQPLTEMTAGPPIDLPTVDGSANTPFPETPAGALVELVGLDEAGLYGGDPDTYARNYQHMALPSAPDPSTTGLWLLLTSLRAHAGLPDTGLVAGFSVTDDVTEGLIKGTTDSGRYAVCCVLGELTVQAQGETISVGVGDCQAFRWTGASWRISPGALPAAAPCAWPGSADAVRAGYRELS